MLIRRTSTTMALLLATVTMVRAQAASTDLCGTILLAPEVLPMAMLGIDYRQPLKASGGIPPYEWHLVEGALPDGLLLSADGELSGNPTRRERFSFTIVAIDAAGCTGERRHDMVVCFAMDLAPSSLPDGVLGALYDQELTALGAASPTMLRVVEGMLPPGLTIQWLGGIQSLLAGTPAFPGLFGFTLEGAEDGCVFRRAYEMNIAEEPVVASSGRY